MDYCPRPSEKRYVQGFFVASTFEEAHLQPEHRRLGVVKKSELGQILKGSPSSMERAYQSKRNQSGTAYRY
jgi:hypothetical protein